MFQVASHSHRPGERPGQGSARRLRKETEADFSGISVPLCVILSHLALAMGSERSDICLIFVALSQFPTCIYEYLHHCVQGLFIFWVRLHRSRLSRESGNPHHRGLWQLSHGKTIWIPACAGMTRVRGNDERMKRPCHCVHPALAAWPGLRSCRGGSHPACIYGKAMQPELERGKCHTYRAFSFSGLG